MGSRFSSGVRRGTDCLQYVYDMPCDAPNVRLTKGSERPHKPAASLASAYVVDAATTDIQLTLA
jgi:hypothetical protein